LGQEIFEGTGEDESGQRDRDDDHDQADHKAGQDIGDQVVPSESGSKRRCLEGVLGRGRGGNDGSSFCSEKIRGTDGIERLTTDLDSLTS
jgi:hypothetical protein